MVVSHAVVFSAFAASFMMGSMTREANRARPRIMLAISGVRSHLRDWRSSSVSRVRMVKRKEDKALVFHVAEGEDGD